MRLHFLYMVAHFFSTAHTPVKVCAGTPLTESLAPCFLFLALDVLLLW